MASTDNQKHIEAIHMLEWISSILEEQFAKTHEQALKYAAEITAFCEQQKQDLLTEEEQQRKIDDKEREQRVIHDPPAIESDIAVEQEADDPDVSESYTAIETPNDINNLLANDDKRKELFKGSRNLIADNKGALQASEDIEKAVAKDPEARQEVSDMVHNLMKNTPANDNAKESLKKSQDTQLTPKEKDFAVAMTSLAAHIKHRKGNKKNCQWRDKVLKRVPQKQERERMLKHLQNNPDRMKKLRALMKKCSRGNSNRCTNGPDNHDNSAATTKSATRPTSTRPTVKQ